VLKQSGNQAAAREFVGKHEQELDTGSRAAAAILLQNPIGNMLEAFENDVEMIAHGEFEVVCPSVSAQSKTTVVAVDKKHTRAEPT
jgi:ABC-type sulfate transport system substrate-binding protein